MGGAGVTGGGEGGSPGRYWQGVHYGGRWRDGDGHSNGHSNGHDSVGLCAAGSRTGGGGRGFSRKRGAPGGTLFRRQGVTGGEGGSPGRYWQGVTGGFSGEVLAGSDGGVLRGGTGRDRDPRR